MESVDNIQMNETSENSTQQQLGNDEGHSKVSPNQKLLETNSSQDNVTQVNQIEIDGHAIVTGDQYDVISGGVAIEGPVLPREGNKHEVLCMLVSHPGHFYVKFINLQHDSLVKSMNNFYNSEEHIDLSVDVLKASQYFAALRVKDADQKKEWIRVQLLHVESQELLNCLLIDEGGFGMFKISELQPLYNQFRSTPKQAIRASLAGTTRSFGQFN